MKARTVASLLPVAVLALPSFYAVSGWTSLPVSQDPLVRIAFGQSVAPIPFRRTLAVTDKLALLSLSGLAMVLRRRRA